MKLYGKNWSRSLAAVAVSSALLLTACGGGGEDGADSAGSGEAVILTFSSWLPTQDHWNELVKAFEAENPGIDIDFTRNEDFDQYMTGLDNQILAGETPDVFGLQIGAAFDDYAEFTVPVDEYASKWIDGVNEEALSQTTTAGGVQAAVPILTAGSEFYLYNKTLMDEVGVELPTDYDSLVAVSKAATDAGYSPFAMGAADGWHNIDFFVWLSNQYSDGDIYKAANGEMKWDSESLVKAGQRWQQLFKDGVFQEGATSTTTYPSARDDYFMARRSIAMPTGSWHVGAALSTSPEVPGTKIEGDEVGMAIFPTIGDKEATATSGVDFALAMSADIDDEQREAANKFIEFMAVGEGQQIWVNTLQGFPAANGAEVEIGDAESQLAKDSVDHVTEKMAGSKYDRKLIVPGNESLEADLGVVLQNIAEGGDVAKELATLN